MKLLQTLEEALSYIKPGMTIMVGGFLGVGSPEKLIDGIIEKNIGDLTLIANDTSFPGVNYGKLIEHKLVKAAYVSHLEFDSTVPSAA